MCRLDDSKTLLKSLLEQFNQTQYRPVNCADLADSEALQALLEQVYRVESLAIKQNLIFDFTASQNLRSVIADVLLLTEGVDYQKRRDRAYENLDTPPELKDKSTGSL